MGLGSVTMGRVMKMMIRITAEFMARTMTRIMIKERIVRTTMEMVMVKMEMEIIQPL